MRRARSSTFRVTVAMLVASGVAACGSGEKSASGGGKQKLAALTS